MIPENITQDQLLSAAYGYVEATETTRRALSLMRRSLSEGITHSRKTLEAAIPELEKKLDECKLSNKHEFAHIASNKRQFDLVRYMRSELHEANLITDAEYFWLCADAPLATSEDGGSPSRERLEEYDAMRGAITESYGALQSILGHPRDDTSPEVAYHAIQDIARRSAKSLQPYISKP